MKDPTEFKQRFKRWQEGERVYEAGKILPEVVVTADDPIKKLVEDVNSRSNADFVNRVKDPNRTWIQDWEHDGYVATHKLSWAEDDGKAIVFPNVQNINGELHDFTDPKYNHGKWDALDSAIERGDTLLMTPKQAKMYTENYKKYYPKGKTFDCGKILPKYDGGENPWIPKGTKVPTENGKEVVVSVLPKKTVVSKQRPSVDDNLTEQQRGLAYLRHLYNIDKPLSGEDPIGELAVEGAALGPVFKGLGWVGKQVAKQAMPYIGRALKPVTNWFAAKALSNSIDDAVGKTTVLPEPMFNASLPNIPDVYHNVYYLPNDFKIKGNFVNRIMSIPEMAKYGDLYAAEKEASDFLVKDVAKRFGRNSPQNATGMAKHIYNGSSGIPSDLKIFYADYSKTPYGGMLLLNAAGVPYITVDPLWGNTSRVLTHELEHYLTALRESGINNSILQPSAEMDKQLLKDWSLLVNNAKTKEAYSDITPVGKTVALLLEDGYKFDDKPEFLPGMINRLKERAATNREIRLRISLENGNVYFEDLDKVIDGLTDDQLLDLLLTENGYSRSFFRELLNMRTTAASGVLKNMREALKYSPAVIPFAIGANTLQEHDKGKSIKSIKPLPKYDSGTDDKTYLPEYEYEATVTPQGTSLEKHKRITNEEDWLKYWGDIGAGYVNKALESVAKPILEGLKTASYFTPLGNATAFGDLLAANINGDKDEVLAGGVGLLPQVRWARNAYKTGKQLMSLNQLWDKHYIHALNDKDLRGVKNLRDAHFIVNAPNTKIKNGDLPVTLYHGTPNKGWNEYDPKFFGSNTDDGYYGKGLYLTETLDDALAYAGIKDRNFEKFTGTKNPYLKRLYVNSETPFVSGALNNDFKIATANEASDRAMLAPHFGRDLKFKIGTPGSESGTVYISNDMIYDPTLVRELENADASIFSNVLHHVDRDPTIVKFDEVIVPKSSLMKYVDPITYDDFGNVIPLSMRDNFSNPDFRFDKGRSIHINPANKGKFNATKKRTGKTTEQLAHSKNPLTRKRAIFALNARKWHH